MGFLTGLLPLRLRGMFTAILAWFLGMALLSLANVWASLTRGSLGLNVDLLLDTPVKAPFYYVIFAMCLATYVLLKRITDSEMRMAFKAIGQDFRRRFLTAPRLLGFVIAAAPAPLFMSVFGSYKRMIPYVNPYDWDPAFMAWDKALHGGYHPWELLQPLLGTPAVTSGINFFYNVWILVLFFTFIWQAWSRRDPALRRQFLVSYLLMWVILGTVMATLLASAGPCYYGRVTGLEDPFAPLMAYLYEVRDLHGYQVWSLKVQETLWEVYQTGGTNLGAGISAMPSLHVATSVLMALLGWRTHRLMGIAYTVFAAIIMIGSVHLGWHYAIDGYLSIAATIALWWAVGRCLRRGANADLARPALDAA